MDTGKLCEFRFRTSLIEFIKFASNVRASVCWASSMMTAPSEEILCLYTEYTEH